MIRFIGESTEGILVVDEAGPRRSEDGAMGPHAERRLAAILSADVKDYSRLMGDDDVATVETLTTTGRPGPADRPEPWPRGGHVGDGLLAEFSSVVAAVQCSVSIQAELTARNAVLAVARRMEIRIGVSLGEVLIDGDRIYGDGINIAARVQALAEGGGVCISGSVCDEIASKLTLDCDRSASTPSRTSTSRSGCIGFAWAPPRASRRCPRYRRRRPVLSIEAIEKPSIAVLPFMNMSDDSEQEHFADGLSDDIITDLARIGGLAVIARNSSFTYKGRAVKISEVGRELRVRYVLEGSVRKVGEQVRITAQLVDAVAGHHLWAERYDRELSDVFGFRTRSRRRSRPC